MSPSDTLGINLYSFSFTHLSGRCPQCPAYTQSLSSNSASCRLTYCGIWTLGAPLAKDNGNWTSNPASCSCGCNTSKVLSLLSPGGPNGTNPMCPEQQPLVPRMDVLPFPCLTVLLIPHPRTQFLVSRSLPILAPNRMSQPGSSSSCLSAGPMSNSLVMLCSQAHTWSRHSYTG